MGVSDWQSHSMESQADKNLDNTCEDTKDAFEDTEKVNENSCSDQSIADVKDNGQIENVEKIAVDEKIPKAVSGVLNLSMSAKEMRELILSRKKKDPRKERRKDMRKRVEMVEAM